MIIIQNLESIYTILNYLVKEVPNILSGNEGENSKLIIKTQQQKNSWNKFLCNIIE